MGTIKSVSVPTKTLSQNLASNGTTLYVSDTLSWDGTQMSSADFGTQAFATLRNSNNSQLEFIEIDPATVTSSNAITILKRGLGYDGSQVASAETAYDWIASDTYVELGSSFPQLLKQLVEEAGNETVTGVKTFSSIPKTTGGNPTDDTELARKAYVDETATGTTNINRVVVAGTAGATIADGNLIYFDDTDNEWKLCDADTAATVDNVILGIAQGAGTDGNAVTNGVLLLGLDDAQTGLTAGAPYYASNTAGGISASPGTTEVSVGFAKSTTELYFVPRYSQQITEDQQDALAGTSGTPGSTNKYVTANDESRNYGTVAYAASSSGNDTYVITLSPAATAYTTGMTIRFKADVGNTGAATINVNSLGAKNIYTYHGSTLGALVTGDIVAGQFVDLVYDGTQFVITSAAQPRPLYATGQTTRAHASGTGTQNIAHGLGVVPRLVKISYFQAAVGASNTSQINIGTGTCTSTSDESCTWWAENDAGTDVTGQTSGQIIHTENKAAAIGWEASVSALDATNITLNFGTADGNSTIYIQWEAYA